MNMVDASPEDLSLREAAASAGVSARTVRRAVHTGALPRRYVRGPRGPCLVFRATEVAAWRARAARKATPTTHFGVLERMSTERREEIQRLREHVARTEAEIRELRAELARLYERLLWADALRDLR